MAKRKKAQRSPQSGGLPLRRLIVVAVLFFAAAMLLPPAAPDPALYPARSRIGAVDVWVVDNGWHAGLVVPVDRLRQFGFQHSLEGAIATSQRFIGHAYAEIGWGDEAFYRQVPSVDKISWSLAWSAVFNTKAPSVLHIAAFDQEPRDAFPAASIAHLRLSEVGFAKLVAAYNDTVLIGPDKQPEDLGKGLYFDSEFYRARGIYNGLHDCNQWVAKLLHAAGVPVTEWSSSTSWMLMTELAWRAGAD